MTPAFMRALYASGEGHILLTKSQKSVQIWLDGDVICKARHSLLQTQNASIPNMRADCMQCSELLLYWH